MELNQNQVSTQKRSVRWVSSFYFNIFLGLFILLGITVISLRTVISHQGKILIEDQTLQLYTEISNEVIDSLTTRTQKTKVLTQSLSNTSPQLPRDESAFKKFFPPLVDHVELKNVVAGGGIWPEPHAFQEGVQQRSFFWGINKEGILEYYNDYNDPKSNGYHNEEWYVPSKWLSHGEVFWSKSYMDPYSFQPMVTCTSPTFENGTYIGCSTIDLKLEGLDEIAQLHADKVGGYIFVTDRNNKFLSFPDKSISKVYTEENGKTSENFLYAKDLAEKDARFKPISDQLDALNSNFLKQYPPKQDLIEKLDNDSYQINRKEATLIASTLSPDAKRFSRELTQFDIKNDILLQEASKVFIITMPETYWKVVTVIPISKTEAIPNSIARSVSSIAIVIVLIAGALTFLFYNARLLKPLKKMTQSIKKLTESQGQDHILLDDSSDDELGVLAHWFNQRSKGLQASLSELKSAYHELNIARIKAEEATKLKNEFMACMSHEIRTPMNAIIGMSHLLEDAKLEEEEQGYLQIIERSSHHLLTIINDILDISKLETGQLKIRNFDFSIKEVSRDIDSTLRAKAERKCVHFEIQTSSDIPLYLFGDSSRLKQVLINLGDNAIKFTEKGFVKIQLNLLGIEDQQHARIQCQVTDTGIGIKEKDVSKLFTPFSQLDASTTRQYEGTGLGLSICKNIVNLMNGTISYEPNPAGGCCFTFDILLKIMEVPPSAKVEHPQPQTKNEALNILLAEDNVDNQIVLVRILERFGYSCDTASDGQIAIDMHQKNNYNLILMDWQMPQLDGFQATKHIRELEKKTGQHCIIVALTANAMDGDKEKCLSAGMDDYLSKPFKKEQIHELIKKYSPDV